MTNSASGSSGTDGLSLGLRDAPNAGYIRLRENWPFDIYTNDVQRLRVAADGNVGIGTASPGSPLTVAGIIESTSGGVKFPDGTVQVTASTAGGSAWSISGNAGTTPGTHYLGTTDNKALEIHVNGLRAAWIVPLTVSPAVIWGHSSNNAAGTFTAGVTISGGGSAALPNRIQASANDSSFATIGGGAGNTIWDEFGTIGGGAGNTAGDDSYTTIASHATVGGGSGNSATGSHATVGGGSGNSATGINATVGGGLDNQATHVSTTVGGGNLNVAYERHATVSGGYSNTAGLRATVPGGYDNTASGDYSFAAGTQARATHVGSFVWACKANFLDFASTADNEFSVRAIGGVRFVSAINFGSGVPTAGVRLAAGGSSWSVISDRAVKENVTAVDGEQILDRLSRIPIAEWNLLTQDPSIRHVGPMAQDFYAAFGLGEDERYINSGDADGIALISIQALYELLLERDDRIEELEASNESLQAQMADVLERLAVLEEALRN